MAHDAPPLESTAAYPRVASGLALSVHGVSGHSSVTGTSRNDFFPGCFLAPGFRSDFFGENWRIPIGSYRFQKGPAGDRLENYRNCPKKSDRNPAAKNQSKRRKPAGSDTEIAETGRLFEVPATGLIDLGSQPATTTTRKAVFWSRALE